jgi:hypothetical protein
MRSQKLILKAMITSPNKCFILQRMEQKSNDYLIKRITIKWTKPTMLMLTVVLMLVLRKF